MKENAEKMRTRIIVNMDIFYTVIIKGFENDIFGKVALFCVHLRAANYYT